MERIVLKSLGIIQNATNSAVLVFAKMDLNLEELTAQGSIFILYRNRHYDQFSVLSGHHGMNGNSVRYDIKDFHLAENIPKVSRSV